MRSILSVVLWLTLLPAAFAGSIDDPVRLSIPSNFENCPNLQPLYGESINGQETGLIDLVSNFGSLTGFIDFSTTDGFLRFLDEYVGASLQSHDLRDTLQYQLKLDFTGIEAQIASIYGQFSLN